MSEPSNDARGLTRQVSRAIEDSERELGSMPFFVRPMVKRGFAKRTGRDFAGWKQLARALAEDAAAGRTPEQIRAQHPGLGADLERLAEHFRTAPERAARGMGGNQAALDAVRERSGEREAAVRALLAWLS